MRRTIDRAVSATGLLGAFNEAGVIGLAEVHVARTLARVCTETDERAILAAALTVAAVRAGSVCLELSSAAQGVPGDWSASDEAVDWSALPWPERTEWLDALVASPMVSVGEQPATNERPLRLVDGLLYLERHWTEEETVRRLLLERVERHSPIVDEAALTDALTTLFGPEDAVEPDQQRVAVATACRALTTVIAGGPGTGKTTVIARLLVALHASRPSGLRIGLAAPTGKAAARLGEIVRAEVAKVAHHFEPFETPDARTLHKLLGSRGKSNGFTYDASNPLPLDVVIVDEMSMVALPLMATLLTALRPDTTLVLVGDPGQLSSVEAGAVLADVVTAALPISATNPTSSVVVLDRNHRNRGAVSDLAAAVRAGDSKLAVEILTAGTPEVLFVDTDAGLVDLVGLPQLAAEVVEQGRTIRALAVADERDAAIAALQSHRIVCAHRRGPHGVSRWAALVEKLLREQVPGYGRGGEWFAGRTVLVNANNDLLGVMNGDTGVVVDTPLGPQVALSTGKGVQAVAPHLLDDLDTLNVMTVHKAQGSQFGRVTLILPPPDSPLLTRELVYTAITRAENGVRIIGTTDAFARAVETRALRASGLADRLR